jgi:hypothetical protein
MQKMIGNEVQIWKLIPNFSLRYFLTLEHYCRRLCHHICLSQLAISSNMPLSQPCLRINPTERDNLAPGDIVLRSIHTSLYGNLLSIGRYYLSFVIGVIPASISCFSKASRRSTPSKYIPFTFLYFETVLSQLGFRGQKTGVLYSRSSEYASTSGEHLWHFSSGFIQHWPK